MLVGGKSARVPPVMMKTMCVHVSYDASMPLGASCMRVEMNFSLANANVVLLCNYDSNLLKSELLIMEDVSIVTIEGNVLLERVSYNTIHVEGKYGIC